MAALSDIENLFVRQVLNKHGEYIVDLIQDSIKEKKIRVTDDLIKSFDYRVVKQGNNYVLQISFLGYGRAVEIQFFKSKRMRREEKEKYNSAQFRRAKKKDTRFYAKNVYGSINSLLGRMSNEYSEQEIKRLKGILEHKFQGNL